jgi:hypothetical protein
MCVGYSRRRSFQSWAGQLFDKALPAAADFAAPRSWAFTLLGIHAYLRRLSGDRMANQMQELLARRLQDAFASCATESWPWCEDIVSYDNAKLAHALILSGAAQGQQSAVDTGLKSLLWLADLHTSEEGYFRPIGSNGFFRRDHDCARFDQQPIEAHSMLSAALEAYRVTEESIWYDQACRAFDWFLGWNDLGLELYSPNTGGCYDALHVDRANQNQGAESTLAFLLSLAEMKLAESAFTAFRQSKPPMSYTQLNQERADEFQADHSKGNGQGNGKLVEVFRALPGNLLAPEGKKC